MKQEQIEALSPSHLAGFSGSDQLFQNSLCRRLVMTEGVQHIRNNGLAWLVDIIASVQHLPAIKAEGFQSWKLTKGENNAADVVCDDGNGNVLYTQHVPFTDFPYASFALFAVDNGEGVTVMLPSEY